MTKKLKKITSAMDLDDSVGYKKKIKKIKGKLIELKKELSSKLTTSGLIM